MPGLSSLHPGLWTHGQASGRREKLALATGLALGKGTFLKLPISRVTFTANMQGPAQASCTPEEPLTGQAAPCHTQESNKEPKHRAKGAGAPAEEDVVVGKQYNTFCLPHTSGKGEPSSFGCTLCGTPLVSKKHLTNQCAGYDLLSYLRDHVTHMSLISPYKTFRKGPSPSPMVIGQVKGPQERAFSMASPR